MKSLRALKSRAGWLALAAVSSFAHAAAADSYSTVHAFSGDRGAPTGGVIEGPDGRLYGTTSRGCLHGRGSVYALIPDGGNGYVEKTLACFLPTDPGHSPVAAPVAGPDGALYGILSEGGAGNFGAIFRITTTGELTFLHSFQGPDGGSPQGALIVGSDGLLYGTTEIGGASNLGTIFRISTSGDFDTLYEFSGANGANPVAALLEVGGADLYGTTAWGGEWESGTLFRITKAGVLTTLHPFNSMVYSPQAPLTLTNDGYLRSTAMHGAYNGGMYRITPTGADFQLELNGLRTRYALIQGSDDWIYGTTEGAAFRWHWTRGGEAFHPFTWPDTPSSGLIEVGNVVFAGTADRGGPHGGGFVFRVGPYGDNDVLHAFKATEQGASPRGTLVEGEDGRFYGVAFEGGRSGSGSIFSVSRAGSLWTLHSFAQTDGAEPQAGLVRGADGALYGSTPSGGPGRGTAFRIDFGGAFEVLHNFEEATGDTPIGDLLAEDNGALYGTTTFGGDNAWGTLYRLDADGTFTPLHSFANIDFANGSLIRASDGSLMGTSSRGGAFNTGTVYRWDAVNGFLSLHEFDSSDGDWPRAGLVEVGSGQFFGTTTDGGEFGYGSVFRIDFDGIIEHIHPLSPGDGTETVGALLPAFDGKLYGTSSEEGALGLGTIFRVATDGAFEKLHDFAAVGGGAPLGPLLRASDGAFYGTASAGGAYGSGAIFRFAAPDLLSVAAVVPDSGPADGGTSLAVSGVSFEAGAAVSIGGVDRPVSVESTELIETPSPAAAPGSLSDLIVTNPSGDSARIVGGWFADFLDVPAAHAFHDYVEAIVREGITGGCGGGLYCIGSPVTRAQMAVFLLKAVRGGAYLPPACTGTFGDVACPSPFADWIEALAAEGVTAGCGLGNYCPNASVTRAQMSVFLLKAREGATYRPPPAVGVFADVPPGSFAADWIEELNARGITGGCNPLPFPLYCPGNFNTRGQMAVFLVRTFGL